ncbi:MAG: tetratricopeptide repeat protein [Chromatiales bacterium]|jgi:tetratricopeptide (TPR) repeat protein|nr:tetratricopeptide repeat protein [Chromatiales bacterium]
MPVTAPAPSKAAFAVLLLFLASAAPAAELWERPWVEVRTDNLRLLSGLDERRSREFAVELENFRRFVLAVTNLDDVRERVPTTVYLMPERRPEFGLRDGVAGYLRKTMRSNELVLSPSGGFLDDAIKHEYVHMVVHNHSPRLYPAWFDEGFAEVLMTFEIKGNDIVFGKVSPLRASWLNATNQYQQVLEFDRLLSVASPLVLERDQMGMFFAQSWLLMHYLNFGRPNADLAAEMTEYLDLTAEGMAPPAAFEQAFGIEVGKLRSVLRKYSTKLPFFRGKMPGPYPADRASVRAVPADEVATQLGWLLMFGGDGAKAAEPYFAAALARNPANARALAGMGDVRKFGGDFAAAEALYQRAIEAEPGNALNELELGGYYADVAIRAAKAGDAAAAGTAWVEARRHYTRSYKINPDIPETLAMNGMTYLAEGRPDKAVESLEMAWDLYPGNEEIRLMLAQALMAAGERAAALPHVQTVAARRHGATSPEFDQWLADLEGRAAAGPAAPAGAAAGPAGAGDTAAD